MRVAAELLYRLLPCALTMLPLSILLIFSACSAVLLVDLVCPVSSSSVSPAFSHPDLNLLSFPLQKRNTAPQHNHRSHHHRHQLPRAKAFGSLFATYLATVDIAGEPYTCILDTGSSDFAVAASSDCGCAVYYKGECEEAADSPHLSVRYGDGNWTGVACTDEVSINGMSLGSVTFAGMRQQTSMLECDATHQQNGIIGLAFPGLLGPPANYTLPFFDLLTQHTHLPAVFALQCCGWQNDTAAEYNSEYAQGALDLGGINRAHVDGEIWYTPITERLFYAVDMIDIRVDGVSTMPMYRRPADAQYRRRHRKGVHGSKRAERTEEGESQGAELHWAGLPFPPQTIVDSGTSNIILTPDIWNRTVAAMKQLVPSQPEAVWRGEQCIQHSSQEHKDVTASWPTLTLVLAGEEGEQPFALHIPPCRYLAKAPAKECKDGRAGHAFAIEMDEDEGIILGQVVYESFYVVHDNERNRVGFGKLQGCDSDEPCLDRVSVQQDDVLIRAKGLTAMHANEELEEGEDEERQTEAVSRADNAAVLDEGVGSGRGGERRWGVGWFVVACVLLVVWWWGWRRLNERKMSGGWKRNEGYQRIGDEEQQLLSSA